MEGQVCLVLGLIDIAAVHLPIDDLIVDEANSI